MQTYRNIADLIKVATLLNQNSKENIKCILFL